MTTANEALQTGPGDGRRVVVAPPRPVARRPLPSPRLTLPRLHVPRATDEERAETPARDLDPYSPTVPVRHVLRVLLVSMVLALLFSARGLVHAANGMPDGFERTVTLAIGQPVLAVTSALHLTAPWDATSQALGRNEPSGAPLLAAAPSPTPTARAGSGQPAAAPSPTPVPPHAMALRRPTAHKPLRLLVTGDSLTEYLGPDLINIATAAGPVRGWTDTHYGTGLVRPDFVDWSVVARQQEQEYNPDAVAVMIGGNDFQNMSMPNGSILYASSPAWTREYERRAAVCMRIWARQGTRRVYWLSMPPARSDAWTHNNNQINLALQGAARQVPGVKYLNINGPITDHGRYSDYVYRNGAPVLVRTPDGIHLTDTGAQIVAGEVLNVIEHDWHLHHSRR